MGRDILREKPVENHSAYLVYANKSVGPCNVLTDHLDRLGSTDATLACDGIPADDFDVDVSNINACLTDDDILYDILKTEDIGSDRAVRVGCIILASY